MAGGIFETPIRVAPRGVLYVRHLRTAFSHGLTVTLRHNRVLLAYAILLAPVVVPILLALTDIPAYPKAGRDAFAIMMEQVYLKAMAPLLALFFACSMVGEDAEMGAMSYVLTRPMARSAWVFGRYGSYLAIALGMLLVSEGLTYVACSSLGGLSPGVDGLADVGRYVGATAAAAAGCGALCVLLGAWLRWPVICGVAFFFGWQRLTSIVPGLVDFLTIEKYAVALLPASRFGRRPFMFRTAFASFAKKEFEVSPVRALITLGIVTLALLCLTVYVVRRREYAGSRAPGS